MTATAHTTTATVYDIESNTVLYQLPASEARRDLAMHRRHGATVTEYATTDRTGRPIHVALTVDSPRDDLAPDQGAVYLFTQPDSTPTLPAPSNPRQDQPDQPDPSDTPNPVTGPYQQALAAYETKGAAHAPDDALMAGFCHNDIHIAVGAVSPQLVWEGAQKSNMTALELCRLAGKDPMAVDALQWL